MWLSAWDSFASEEFLGGFCGSTRRHVAGVSWLAERPRMTSICNGARDTLTDWSLLVPHGRCVRRGGFFPYGIFHADLLGLEHQHTLQVGPGTLGLFASSDTGFSLLGDSITLARSLRPSFAILSGPDCELLASRRGMGQTRDIDIHPVP